MPILKISCTEEYLNKKINITIQESKHNGLKCVNLVKTFLNCYPSLKPLLLVLKQFMYSSNYSDPYSVIFCHFIILIFKI